MKWLTTARTKRGFTIIELLVTVAILAILASIAVPSYQRSIFRARQAEAIIILGNLKVNQWSYFGSYDCFASTEQHPVGTPGVLPLPWMSVAGIFLTPCDGAPRTLKEVGLEPDISQSYYQYQCAAQVPMGAAVSNEFTCSGRADLDGDSMLQEYLFCTDQARTGTGLASPQTGAACTFPYDVFRVSIGSY